MHFLIKALCGALHFSLSCCCHWHCCLLSCTAAAPFSICPWHLRNCPSPQSSALPGCGWFLGLQGTPTPPWWPGPLGLPCVEQRPSPWAPTNTLWLEGLDLIDHTAVQSRSHQWLCNELISLKAGHSLVLLGWHCPAHEVFPHCSASADPQCCGSPSERLSWDKSAPGWNIPAQAPLSVLPLRIRVGISQHSAGIQLAAHWPKLVTNCSDHPEHSFVLAQGVLFWRHSLNIK